mmetsp:Transcript_74776/g.118980  ORF Transcript_74776/g.118980 Transcript_74776/m.118980 type:complete len:290 (+) Transcript_74776:29-898(+)|eukprot:CAMPEP_0197032534 /NCGR_PEP_ID=MMETSP1384-20130603/11196_1 /TAXON_ID=29189 /ORGANISM="Ammonia sp." /LENGTH=289 /DNA_ID=CAMNT_0042462217 /DNA_START=24 /DNA_END=893 /DNA_ORIENTATION=+
MAAAEEKQDNNDQIKLRNKKGTATAIIHRYGATVLSFQVDEEEQLFVSSKAKFDRSKAIRGGIPLVYPQFGPGAMPQHGFARVTDWTLHKKDDDVAILTLKSDDLADEWKQRWKYSFALQYTVRVTDANTLCTELSVSNAEKESAFEFTVLLHTYFRVNAAEIKVFGLKGLQFSDKLEADKDAQIKKEENEAVGIASEVDRVYMNIGEQDIVLVDASKAKYPKMTIQRQNFSDVVLWNPWIAKAAQMGDFDDAEYKNMVCIEPGNVAKPVTLKAGETNVFKQTLIPSKM